MGEQTPADKQRRPDTNVDAALIRWTLSLSPIERLALAQDLIDKAWGYQSKRETT